MLQNLKSIFNRYSFVITATFITLGVLVYYVIQRFLAPSTRMAAAEFYIIVFSVSVLMLSLIALLQRARSLERYRLTHDSVTSLLYKTQVPAVIKKGTTAYVFLHLREYQQYLERYGLVLCDSFVRVAAEVIQDKFKEYTESLYRFADADFLLICNHPGLLEDIQKWFQEIAYELTDETFLITPSEDLNEISVRFVLSIGVASIAHSPNVETVATYAHFASQAASRKEGAQTELFDLKEYLQQRAVIERRQHLSEIIEAAQLTTVFMPIISCKDGSLYGYEALTRPTNPSYQSISDLLDDAEIMGMYSQLELLMTLTAVQTFRELGSDSRLFINMAPETIRKGIYNLPIQEGIFDNIKFVIEIIERGEVLLDIIKILTKTLGNLNAMIALDDFGAGYSNHLALLNSKPDIVKVDRALIDNIEDDPDKQRAYENIVSFARGMGVQVLAEGVETQKQFEYLLRFGMDYSQGYYIGRPTATLGSIPEGITKIVEQYKGFSELLAKQQSSRF